MSSTIVGLEESPVKNTTDKMKRLTKDSNDDAEAAITCV